MIGETIKKVRRFKKIPQKELASMLGISANTLYRYECGDISISLEMLNRIADALDVSVNTLLVNPDEIPERKPKNIKFNEEISETQLQNVTSEDIQNALAALGESFHQLHDTIEKLNNKGKTEVNRYAEYLTTKEEYTKPDDE